MFIYTIWNNYIHSTYGYTPPHTKSKKNSHFNKKALCLVFSHMLLLLYIIIHYC